MGRITFIGHGSDIKPIFVVGIDRSLKLFKGIADFGMQFVQKGGLKGVTQEFVVEVFFMTPAKRIPNPAFRNETMDMGIPFQVPAKGMKDTDKPRSKEFGFVIFMEHTRDNTVNGREKAV